MVVMSKQIHKILLSKSVGKYSHVTNLLDANGVVSLIKSEDTLFKHMARLVCSQQLSLKAAETIWHKIINRLQEDKLCLIEACNWNYTELLRACGLSRNKVKALQELKQAFERGDISHELIMKASQKDVSELVCKLWGFGPWSGEMIAMFYCGLQDVWSDGDLILNKGINKLSISHGILPSEFLAHFSPYKSYLALHIWKGKNSGII